MIEALFALQGSIHRAITADLLAFAAVRDWLALAAVLPLGVVFGAAHALTPGHGKTVLASYVAGSRLAGLRASCVAGALTLTHVGSAVVLALLAGLLLMDPSGFGRTPALEDVSRDLLVAIGCWLVARAARGRVHDDCPGHGHAGDDGMRGGLVVGVVAGLVPCPLTLFMMMFALGRGVPEAGLTFVLAMLVGIGLTLSTVALLASLARERLIALAVRLGGSLGHLARLLKGATGAALIAIGLTALLT